MSDPTTGLAFCIRDAAAADMPIVQRIYAHHVEQGLASFEEMSPDTEEITRRWRAVTAMELPYLVAEDDARILGYAYAAAYRPRPAYRYTVEDTVYLDNDLGGRGIGTALLRELIARCEAAGVRQMVAVIGDTANRGSVRLHARLGFRQVGILHAVGFKMGRWVDSVTMQRALGDGEHTLPGE